MYKQNRVSGYTGELISLFVGSVTSRWPILMYCTFKEIGSLTWLEICSFAWVTELLGLCPKGDRTRLDGLGTFFFFLCVMWWNILTRGSADSPQGEEEWGGWEKERVQNERKIIRKEGGKQKEMAITTARNRQVIWVVKSRKWESALNPVCKFGRSCERKRET